MSGNKEVVMKRAMRIWWVGLVVILLVLPAVGQAMPPHPSLLDKIARGEVQLPDYMAAPELRALGGPDQPEAAPSGLTGTVRALVVLVDFSDKVKTVTATYFDTLVFAAPVVGRGSVRDYFNEVSYGAVDIVTVNLPSSIGWKRAPQTLSYYVSGGSYGTGTYPNNCQKLAEDLVEAVDGVVDYATPIMIVHAGRGAEFTGSASDIWSHSWSLKTAKFKDGVWVSRYVIMPEYWLTVSASTSDMTIGVFAHEMGHGFWNLPDLYDRTNVSSGIGNWSLMAGGSWNGPVVGGYTLGASPAWPDAWSRVQMGVVTPTVIRSKAIGKSIPQAYNNPGAQTVLKLTSKFLAPLEYFLVENRQQTANTYDQYLPGNGLFIWHIDEAQWTYTIQNDRPCTQPIPCNCSPGWHYLVALEQADNLLNLEKKNNRGDAGDPFPGSTNKRIWTMATQPGSGSWYSCQNTKIGITNISNSGAVMTADIQVPGASVVAPYQLLLLSN
jgi:immune inhibitor A